MKLEGKMVEQSHMYRGEWQSHRPSDKEYGSDMGSCGLRHHRSPWGCPWSVLPSEAMGMSVTHAATAGHVSICIAAEHVDVRGLCCCQEP